MHDYTQFKSKIRHRSEILEETIRELDRTGLADANVAKNWLGYLGAIGQCLQAPLLKIAVAGSVKSGKSTLINAMVGDDLLKRGAGIITAFITRVLTADAPGGWVELKSWPQVNEEVKAALRMLPVFSEGGGAPEDLDLRRPDERDRIAFWLDRMKSEWLQSRGNIDPHFIFLERCLQGFPLVEGEIGEEAARSSFDKSTIAGHRDYVGEESRSVYVRDIELHYPVSWLGERIELADCQGSDSPNPAHFELLQKYLLDSHFVVYVIGSRTGLREADFKLLDAIRALRMFPQTLFVLNVDFDAHNDREDLDRVFERVSTELGWVAPEPPLFAFSALFQLVKQLGDRAPKAERRRMKLWKDSKALSKGAEAGFAAFKKAMEERIRASRSAVLAGFGLSRLEMVAANMLDSVRLGESALEKSADGIKEAAEQLRARHFALQSTMEGLAETVAGLNQTMKREIGARIECSFDFQNGPIVREAVEMVEHHRPKYGGRLETLDHAALIREYYGFYLDFRRDITRRLIDRINLRIMEFAKQEEILLRERIGDAFKSLWGFFDAALADYRRDLLGNVTPSSAEIDVSHLGPDLSNAVLPPPFSSYLEKGGLVRGILLVRFGLSSFAGLLSGIRARMRRSISPNPDAEAGEKTVEELFEKALLRARNEAKSELLHAFEVFREDLKTGYLHRIADEACIFLLREFKARAEMAQVDFANLLRQSELQGVHRVAAIETLTRTRQITSAMIEELKELRLEIQAGPQ